MVLKIPRDKIIKKYGKQSGPYFDLNKEVPEMFPESSDVLIQIKETFHGNLKLELC